MKRHRDFTSFDKITLEVEERWKESSLSGDEWRFSITTKFWFKGMLIGQYSAHNMTQAILNLGSTWSRLQSPLPNCVLEREEKMCCQPGCKNEATRFYQLRETFARDGSGPIQSYGTHFRQFCDKHSKRGDCSREDADANYVEIPREQARPPKG